jgi:hypothetical protein
MKHIWGRKAKENNGIIWEGRNSGGEERCQNKVAHFSKFLQPDLGSFILPGLLVKYIIICISR